MIPRRPVVVAGAGLSGLAAAVTLASQDIPVVVFEQKPHLGGRAYSFLDSTAGEMVDNGQHVLIRGYAATMRLLETLGTTRLLSFQPSPSLVFHHPVKGFRTFRLPSWPPPLHLLGGVLGSNLFGIADRLRTLRAGLALRSCTEEVEQQIAHLTIAEWLRSQGQSEEAVRSFWEPLAVSIMNEHVATASALLFVRSLRTAFLAEHSNASLAIPTVGLSDLYANPAREFIARRGGSVRCSMRVASVKVNGEGVTGVILHDGSFVEASAVVIALPPSETRVVLLEQSSLQSLLTQSSAIVYSPIVSVHLWFRQEVMKHGVVGLIGRTVQWVFNRRKLAGGTSEGGHVSATISAAHDLVGRTLEDIVRVVMADLRSTFGPAIPEPWHALVIREKRATFSATPAAEQLRPDQRTPLKNLFLAGDWTATGYPATIEGAVISGERSAALVGEYLRCTT
jgi:hydroxysqualene dehydroxylase